MGFRSDVEAQRAKVRDLEEQVRRHPPRRPVLRRWRWWPLLLPVLFGLVTLSQIGQPYSPLGRWIAYGSLTLAVITALLGPLLFFVLPSTRAPDPKKWRALVQARVEIGVEDETEQLDRHAEALEAYLEHERPKRREQ